jgi:hypothetical protein
MPTAWICKGSLVQPRKVACRSTFPELNGGKPLQLWIVLEESPGERDGYLIVFDDRQGIFGLVNWDGDVPVLIGAIKFSIPSVP